MLYPTERLSLMLVFPGASFQLTLYGGYKPQRIRKAGIPMLTGPRREVYYINFVRTHAPKQCKRDVSVCTRRSSSAPRTACAHHLVLDFGPRYTSIVFQESSLILNQLKTAVNLEPVTSPHK